MRSFLITLLALIASNTSAQQPDSLPPLPIAEELSAPLHLEKAARAQETSIWWALAGGSLTVVAADMIHRNDEHAADTQRLAVGLGSIALGGFCFFQIKSAKHTRKAARALATP